MFSYKAVFPFLFSILFFSNSYSHSIFPISKQIYYEQNKWDFMDDFFVKKVNNSFSKYDLIPKIVAMMPLGATFSLFAYGADHWSDAIGPCLVLGILIFGFSKFLYCISKEAVYNKSLEDKIIKSLSLFLKNYDPDIKMDLGVNLKKFIPEEFHEMFDSLYNEYSYNEKASLKSAIDIIYNIRSKVEYDLKYNKYKKPDVVYIDNTIYGGSALSC